MTPPISPPIQPKMPGPKDAAQITAELTGQAVSSIRRFKTGNANFVYHATLADGSAVVTRMTRPDLRPVADAAAGWNRRLRELGVPLPDLLVSDLDGPFPTLLLEHLPGTDLGACVGQMTTGQLDKLIEQLIQMHRLVHDLPTAGRFGFAACADQAPHASWFAVLDALVTRINPALSAEKSELHTALIKLEGQISQIQPTPFLHDTTTKNVLIGQDGRLVGIVDVDDLCWGDPRFVIALTHVGMALADGPDDYADKWLHRAGYADDAPYRLSIALHALAIKGEILANSNQNGLDNAANPKEIDCLTRLFQHSLSTLPL
ncbi:MAG: hypothetical protein Alpg2KO_23910 [Alphaproteobacteria bacterium]